MSKIGQHESIISSRQLAARELEKKSCELKSRGFTLAAIAEILECSVTGVHKAINRSMQAAITLRDRDASLLLELYRMRLERLLRIAMDRVVRDGHVSWEAWDRSLKASQALAELDGVIQTKGVSVVMPLSAVAEVGVSYKEPARLEGLQNLSFQEVVEMRRLMVKAGASDVTIPVTPLLESGSLQRVGAGTVDSLAQNGAVKKRVVKRNIIRRVVKKKP